MYNSPEPVQRFKFAKLEKRGSCGFFKIAELLCKLSSRLTQDDIIDRLRETDWHVFAVELDHQLIGGCLVREHNEFFNGTLCEIAVIGVVSEYQGEGIGSHFLEHLKENYSILVTCSPFAKSDFFKMQGFRTMPSNICFTAFHLRYVEAMEGWASTLLLVYDENFDQRIAEAVTQLSTQVKRTKIAPYKLPPSDDLVDSDFVRLLHREVSAFFCSSKTRHPHRMPEQCSFLKNVDEFCATSFTRKAAILFAFDKKVIPTKVCCCYENDRVWLWNMRYSLRCRLHSFYETQTFEIMKKAQRKFKRPKTKYLKISEPLIEPIGTEAAFVEKLKHDVKILFNNGRMRACHERKKTCSFLKGGELFLTRHYPSKAAALRAFREDVIPYHHCGCSTPNRSWLESIRSNLRCKINCYLKFGQFKLLRKRDLKGFGGGAKQQLAEQSSLDSDPELAQLPLK